MDNPENDLGQVLGIGEHCSVDHCRQIDFLPFKCDCCNRTFCLEHRSYTSHSCPNAGAKETIVIVCPICAKSVRLNGRDPNEVFEVHQRTECDPANYVKVHKKPRCPVGGCKEKLTTINTYRCKHCSQRVCLRHRDPGDHGCAEAQAALRQQRGSAYAASNNASSSGRSSAASSWPSSAPRAATGTGVGATTSAAAGSGTAAAASTAPSRRLDAQQRHAAAVRQYEDPENSVRGTAARRQQLAHQAQQQQQQPSSFQWPWQQQQQQQQQPQQQRPPPAPSRPPAAAATAAAAANNSNANPLVPPHLPESCPQCGARFATVERLIQHVEDFHPSGASGTSGGPGGAAAAAAAPSPPASGGAAAPVFSNPLRGLLGATTIAGGEAPVAAQGPGLLRSGTGGAGNGGGGGAREVFRCYFCSQTFNDPVLLVQHSDRCSATAASGAAATATGGRGGRSGGGGGGSGPSGASKDNCIVC